MATNETRVKHTVAQCPACGMALTMHLQVELGEHSIVTANGQAVDVQFEAPKVTGAVLDTHNCIRPKVRSARDVADGRSSRG